MKNKEMQMVVIIGIAVIGILALATVVRAHNNSDYENMYQGMMGMMSGHMHTMIQEDFDAMHETCEEVMGGEMHEECEEVMNSGNCPMMS